MSLMEEWRIVRGGRRGIRPSEERNLSREEIRETIRNFRDRKATKKDGVPSEVWKYGGKEIGKWVSSFYDKI